MKDRIRNLLSLSSAEQKGVILLVIIVLVLSCIQAFLAFHKSGVHPITDSLLTEELRYFEQHLTARNDSSYMQEAFFPPVMEDTYELFNFDPNSISAGDLRRLGLNDRLIRTMIRYRMHGGRFDRAEDMKRIYGMPDVIYVRLEPYIKIKSSEKYQASLTDSYKNAAVPRDINLADSVTLERLQGIGPVLSGRIVKYRALLGGFYETGQLREVYGLPDSLILVMSHLFFADTLNITRISVNQANKKELARHPYIGKYAAEGIVKYRSAVQTIRSIEELKFNGLLSDEQYNKLKYYLTI